MKKLLTLLGVFLISGQLFSQIHLPSFFSDNMVLQRNTEINIWGRYVGGQEITIIPSWSNDTVKVKSTGFSRFDAKLKTPQAGGPYEITIKAGVFNKVITNILIGEVWLCSGQSNMQMNANHKLQEIIDELPNANNPKIRLLNISRMASMFPQDNIYDSWTTSSKETVRNFSAIGYFIAKQLSSELDVPVGVINSSWPGTQAELWTPVNIINADEELLANAKVQKPSATKPDNPGVLWNTMVNPLVGYTMAGVFWYQGESNVPTYSSYNKLFSSMITSWRDAWGYEFPFYYVQIAPYDYKSKPEKQRAALLREQQVKTLRLPKTGMAVITDLVPDIKDIHPTKKKEVAARLSEMALVDVYGKKMTDYKSPVYKSHKIEGNKIIVEFNYLEGKLKVNGDNKIIDLVIADESKQFVPADYQLSGNKLIVFNKNIKQPVAVRFGFTDVSMPNLFNSRGLPVSPFRTDNQKL